MCLDGVMCLGAHEGWSREMPGLQARPPPAGSAAGFGGGLSIPGQRPRGTAQAPPCPALVEPNSPKSLHKHPAVPAPRRGQVLAPAPPSSGGPCTVKGGGDPAVPISQPSPSSCPVGICPAPAHATGTRFSGTFADPVTSALPTQPQPRAGRGVGRRCPAPLLGEWAPPASLGTFSGHRKMRRHKGAAVLPSPGAVMAPSPGSAAPAAGRAAAGSGR